MPYISDDDKFFWVCFENHNGAAGLLDFRKRGISNISKDQFHRLIEIVREDLLENFRETRVLNVYNVRQKLANEFENLSVELDININDRDVEHVNEMFVGWFGENVDISFIIDSHRDFIPLSSEGSEEKIFELFQQYGIA